MQMVLGHPCERAIQNPRGAATHRLRTTALDHLLLPSLCSSTFAPICKSNSDQTVKSIKTQQRNFNSTRRLWNFFLSQIIFTRDLNQHFKKLFLRLSLASSLNSGSSHFSPKSTRLQAHATRPGNNLIKY